MPSFVKLSRDCMQVLIPDDRRGHRDSLRKLLQREREVQVSGIAEESESAPDRAIARELRRALDGCPICEGSYRDHSYSILATVDIAEHWQSPLRVKEYPEEEGNSLLPLLPPEVGARCAPFAPASL